MDLLKFKRNNKNNSRVHWVKNLSFIIHAHGTLFSDYKLF